MMMMMRVFIQFIFRLISDVSPHGHYIFNISVPERPAYWVINAFSMSKHKGFGMIPRTIQVVYHSDDLVIGSSRMMILSSFGRHVSIPVLARFT